MAIELEETATAARGQEDPAARAAASADIRRRIQALQAKNTALQAELDQFQVDLHSQAGDPATPAPKDPG